MAENNHQRTLALRAPRGVLFDRNGKVLVENRHSFTISIVREHTKDLDRTVRLLSRWPASTRSRCKQIVDRHRGEPTLSADRRRRGCVAGAGGGDHRAAARLRAARRRGRGSADAQVSERCHGGAPVRLRRRGQRRRRSATASTQGDIIGQQGIEKAYNKLLMGEDGAKRVVVNSMGREIRTLEEIPPTEGRRVQLTLDYDLQKAAEDGFRHAGFNGAALIMDPRNGEVLTYTSLPSYDPNDFAAGIDRVTWASLNTDKLRPLQNRVLQGRYSPGSTFKIVVATAALEEGLVTPDFTGHLQRRRERSSAATTSATSRAATASSTCGTRIEKSCNVYFYTLGNMLGVDKIHKWAQKLGLGGEDRHRSAERAGEPRAEHRVEAEAHRREVVRRARRSRCRSVRARCR